MFIFSKKWLYRLAFLIALLAVFYMLYSPFLARFFYPFPYCQEVLYHAERHQVDPYLVAAIIKVESGFEPEAISPRGARGLMQLMPSTAEWVSENTDIDKSDFHVDTLYDPNYNISLGTWYLSHLMERFDNNLAQVLAAYNGGQGQVKEWINKGVWDGNGDNLEDIPFRETRQYVRKVKRAYLRYEQIYSSGEEAGKEGGLWGEEKAIWIMDRLFYHQK